MPRRLQGGREVGKLIQPPTRQGTAGLLPMLMQAACRYEHRMLLLSPCLTCRRLRRGLAKSSKRLEHRAEHGLILGALLANRQRAYGRRRGLRMEQE